MEPRDRYPNCAKSWLYCGVIAMVAGQAHNLKVVGSSPTSATMNPIKTTCLDASIGKGLQCTGISHYCAQIMGIHLLDLISIIYTGQKINIRN